MTNSKPVTEPGRGSRRTPTVPESKDESAEEPSRRGGDGLLAGMLGGIAGFAIASVVYLLVNPVLEDSTSWVRELQGMLWNLVPLLTVAGTMLGWWIASRLGPRER